MSNLPHPPKVSELDGHAFVSLKDCLADLLGHGLIEVDVLHSDKHVLLQSTYSKINENETPWAAKIVVNATDFTHPAMLLHCS